MSFISNIRPHILLIALLLVVGGVVGCGDAAPVEPPAAEPPPLPEELEQTGQEAPSLLVYIAEEETVEEMDFEEYIAGVVAGEMEPTWPKEALAAQAIIARTFTLQKIAENGGVPERNAHASTDIEEFQAYSGEDVTDEVREAVEMTRGEVVSYNDEFIRAWFSAYAGPRTAQAGEGLGFEEENPPYIHVVDSPGQEIIPEEEGEWSESFSLEEVRNVVREETGEDPGEVTQMEIKDLGPSGRAATILVNDTEIGGPALRLGLGSTEMRSNFIEELSVDDGMVKISGKGYGHGVGVCQWGARAMAENGSSPEEIIQYFYKDINLAKVWE